MAGFKININRKSIIEKYKGDMAKAFENSGHFVAEMDHLVKDRKAKTDDKVKAEKAQTKPKYHQLVEADFEDQIEFDTVTGPMFYFNWAFAHAYSTCELFLTKYCELHYSDGKLKIKDIQGKHGIDILKKYITKVCEIDTTDLKSEFDKLNEYRLIRNRIVHSLSDVIENRNEPVQKQKLFGIVKKYGIKVNTDHHFYIDNQKFIRDFNALAEGLIRKLIDRTS